MFLLTAAIFYLLGNRATLQRVKTITTEKLDTNAGVHAAELLRPSKGLVGAGQPASLETADVTRAQLYLDEKGVPSRFIPIRDQ